MTGTHPGHLFFLWLRRNYEREARRAIKYIGKYLHLRRGIMEKRRYRVTITVGGESYTIRGDTEPERVQKVAAIFDERLRQTERAYPSLPPAKIAVLTGLNLTDEYLRLQEDYQQLLAMVKQVR